MIAAIDCGFDFLAHHHADLLKQQVKRIRSFARFTHKTANGLVRVAPRKCAYGLLNASFLPAPAKFCPYPRVMLLSARGRREAAGCCGRASRILSFFAPRACYALRARARSSLAGPAVREAVRRVSVFPPASCQRP